MELTFTPDESVYVNYKFLLCELNCRGNKVKINLLNESKCYRERSRSGNILMKLGLNRQIWKLSLNILRF